MRKNLGASLYTKFGYDGVFVISPTGATPYSVVDGQLQTISLERALGFNPINALKKELLVSNGQAISHLVTRNGTPAILSAAGSSLTIPMTLSDRLSVRSWCSWIH